MDTRHGRAWTLRVAILVGTAAVAAGCGSKEAPPAAEPAATPAAAAPAAAPETAAATTPAAADAGAPATPASWTPEALEELLAPVALYPDPVLSQVLIASTNPQEVLDAGNWLLQNEQLEGDALDQAARAAGFTPPVRALVQFPDVLDMMCRELDWTTQLGEAFKADQAGVLDAVQRLRLQAQDVGTLKSSPQMQVVNEKQDGKEVVVLKPAANGEVYVPQYDPVAVYSPPPATATTTTTVPATTTTTTTQTGYSTGALVTTGLLAFGAGILVNELFDDDDDYKKKYYYPNYGYGGMPYYPPYAYRPAYGNGWYPSHGYYPPPGYGNKYVNNGNIYINTGGNKYWDRWNGQPPPVARPYGQTRPVSSPITTARPNRNDLNELNKRQPRPMPANVQRPTNPPPAQNWKGQKTYAGAGRPAGERPQPKVQGSYGGGSYAGTRDAKTPTPVAATRDAKVPAGGYQGNYQGANKGANKGAKDAPRGDRGYGDADRGGGSRPQPKPMNVQPQDRRDVASTRPQAKDRPQPQTQDRQPYQAQDRAQPQSRDRQSYQTQDRQKPQPQSRQQSPQNRGGRDSAMGGADRGSSDRQASQRGRQSMPQGAHSKGGGKKGGQQGKKR